MRFINTLNNLKNDSMPFYLHIKSVYIFDYNLVNGEYEQNTLSS